MEAGTGVFVWRELMTSDIEGAKAFYGGLFGWTWQAADMPDGMVYWMGCKGETTVCGVMGLMDAPMPFWASYLQVADIQASTARAAELGGEVCMPPQAIPGTGFFSMVKDPTGAPLMLFQSNTPWSAPTGSPPMDTFCWESLQTPDLDKAKAFYAALVGWGFEPMGPEMALASSAQGMVADLGPVQGGAPPHWSTHVAVADLAASRARVTELGGTVVVPEIPVPGFGRMCLFTDPQGGFLSIFQGDAPAS